MTDSCRTFENVFSSSNQSYTYDDIILMPGYIDFTLDEITMTSRLTKKIVLQTPFVSSPMDTVTESDMAIQLALQGGIGIIHCNNTVDEQLDHVKRVKRYSNGIVSDPITIGLHNTVSDVKYLQQHNDFTSFPVVDDDGYLRGMVSSRDIEFIDNDKMSSTLVKDIMNKTVVTMLHTHSLEEIRKKMIDQRVKRIPLIDKDQRIKGLVCRKDIINFEKFPLATRNKETKQLLVGAAVSTHKQDRERIDRLVKEGNVDVIVVDSAQGASTFQIETIRYIKDNYPNVEVIGGNVVTGYQATHLIEAGVDGLRVGMGVGSICTTQDVCGVGRGQASAIYNVVNIASQEDIPVIADGGISSSGSIVKALCLGASTVMMGSMLAGTEESPGQVMYKDGIRLKAYRGMGSKAASNVRTKNMASKTRYCDTNASSVFVEQGVSGAVVSKGSVKTYIPYIRKAVMHGMQDIGAKSVNDCHVKTDSGVIRMELRSTGSQREGMVHDLYSYEK